MRGKHKTEKTRRSNEGIVILFDDNRGEGVIRLNNGQRVKVSYKDIKKESMFFLSEGEKVKVFFDEDGKVIKVDKV